MARFLPRESAATPVARIGLGRVTPRRIDGHVQAGAQVLADGTRRPRGTCAPTRSPRTNARRRRRDQSADDPGRGRPAAAPPRPASLSRGPSSVAAPVARSGLGRAAPRRRRSCPVVRARVCRDAFATYFYYTSGNVYLRHAALCCDTRDNTRRANYQHASLRATSALDRACRRYVCCCARQFGNCKKCRLSKSWRSPQPCTHDADAEGVVAAAARATRRSWCKSRRRRGTCLSPTRCRRRGPRRRR